MSHLPKEKIVDKIYFIIDNPILKIEEKSIRLVMLFEREIEKFANEILNARVGKERAEVFEALRKREIKLKNIY